MTTISLADVLAYRASTGDPDRRIVIYEYEDETLGIRLTTRIKLLFDGLMCPTCGCATDKLIVSARGLRCLACNASPAQRRKDKRDART